MVSWGGGSEEGSGGLEGLKQVADLHGRHGFVLEGDEGHAQWLGVDFLLLLPVLLLQLGLPLGVEAHRLLLQVNKGYYTHWAAARCTVDCCVLAALPWQ